MASSISDFAPLAAIPPRILPSAMIGSPPWLGKKFGNASASTLPFFTASAASFDGLLYSAACRAFFCANSMVLIGAASPFCRKSRFPLSSTMQIVTSTLRFFASASAAATMVLTAARSKYFFVGKSFEGIAPARLSNTKSKLNMRAMLSIAPAFFHAKMWRVVRPGGLELPTFWFVVKFSFAISLICLGSAYLLHPGFRWFSGLIGPILDPTCGRNPCYETKNWAHLQIFIQPSLHLVAGEGGWG